jgi:UDP-GlcNAc:undecaprenyl-phosphate GlcNAc-1-phosphate transferase
MTALAVGHFLARFMLSRAVLPDHPNARSSHTRVTSRAGGFAVVGGWTAAALLAIGFSGASSPAALAGLAFVGLVLAAFLLGLADDRGAMSWAAKLLGQTAVAVVFVILFGSLSVFALPGLGEFEAGSLGPLISVFWLVAAMNAFNFMDGVDGIATSCGALALAAVAAIAVVAGATFWAVAAGLCAVSLAGFLPFNFPKASMFLGDNGSQAVGFVIAATGLAVARADAAPLALFAPVVILPFLFDAGLTLLRRAFARRHLATAHRAHLYQFLVRLGWTHAETTAAYAAATLVCGAAAALMLTLPAPAQWAAPLALAAVFALPAAVILRAASRAGLVRE